MDQQSLVRTYLRGPLNTGFLVDPVEQRLDGLPDAAYGLVKQLIGSRECFLPLVSLDWGQQVEVLLIREPVLERAVAVGFVIRTRATAWPTSMA